MLVLFRLLPLIMTLEKGLSVINIVYKYLKY